MMVRPAGAATNTLRKAALYVLLNRSDLFGIGSIESGTLPLGTGQMLRETAFLARGPDRIYIVGASG